MAPLSPLHPRLTLACARSISEEVFSGDTAAAETEGLAALLLDSQDAAGILQGEGAWPCQQADNEILWPLRAYRVLEMPGYPGVQYRRSKHMGDRHPRRYAASGSVVHGSEEDGAWLRLTRDLYLPLAVNGSCVLERLAAMEGVRTSRSFAAPSSRSGSNGGRKASAATYRPTPLSRQASSVGSEEADETPDADPLPPGWLCGSVPGAWPRSPCSIKVRKAPIVVVAAAGPVDATPSVCHPGGGGQDLEEDLWDTMLPPSPRSLQPALPALPTPAPPELPARAPTGDTAADAAERLLARVVDPFDD